jgi:hypothetical protein
MLSGPIINIAYIFLIKKKKNLAQVYGFFFIARITKRKTGTPSNNQIYVFFFVPNLSQANNKKKQNKLYTQILILFKRK